MDDTAKLLSISKKLEKLIDHTVKEISNTYMNQLIKEENTYIVPAVWGVLENAELDGIRKAIHKKTRQLVNDAISALRIKHLDGPQTFAVRYLVNRAVIYGVIYKVETTKHLLSKEKMKADLKLLNLPPSGSA